MTDLPRKVLSPAEFIRNQLDVRGMTQLDLAFVLGTSQQSVNQLALGKRGVSADMAKALGEVFETPAEEILGMQKAAEIEAELGRAKPIDPAIARKARLAHTYPLREMIRRGWLSNDPATIEAQLADFFGLASADEIPRLDHAAKKTTYGETPPAQLAWLFRVRQIARRVVVPDYSEHRLRALLPELRKLMITPDAASKAPQMLSDCGVRVVLVENLPGGKIDGACFWLDPESPVIGLSMRFDRIDNFWFVLAHEAEHVLNRHGAATATIDVGLASESADEKTDASEEERIANAAASDFLVPTAKMDSWIARKTPFFSENDLLGFAKLQKVHPGIVAGQLRHRIRDYRLFRDMLVKIRHVLILTAVIDGWGERYPTK